MMDSIQIQARDTGRLILMDNHVRRLIETLGLNFSRDMWQLNGVYTQGFNRPLTNNLPFTPLRMPTIGMQD